MECLALRRKSKIAVNRRPLHFDVTEPTLTINEIYFSIQGESTWAGLAVRFCPSDFLRSALLLLRHGIRILRGEKADIAGNRLMR